MENRRFGILEISQEWLKMIACLCMLLDHIGAAVYPCLLLRCIGRVSFPIFCFLLAEGSCHTHSPCKYAARLFIAMLLSEIPFDYLFFRTAYWQYQNVMLTLLLGLLALQAMERIEQPVGKLLAVIPFAWAAEWFNGDYGARGVLMVLLFRLTMDVPRGQWIRVLGLLILNYTNERVSIFLFGMQVPIQEFAVFAMIPICMYSGEKISNSKVIQWAFYLFYPLHMLLLWLVRGAFILIR